MLVCPHSSCACPRRRRRSLRRPNGQCRCRCQSRRPARDAEEAVCTTLAQFVWNSELCCCCSAAANNISGYRETNRFWLPFTLSLSLPLPSSLPREKERTVEDEMSFPSLALLLSRRRCHPSTAAVFWCVCVCAVWMSSTAVASATTAGRAVTTTQQQHLRETRQSRPRDVRQTHQCVCK